MDISGAAAASNTTARNLMFDISQLFRVIAEALGLAGKRQELENAPDVKAAAVAADEAREVDRERKNVERQDTDEVRKGIS